MIRVLKWAVPLDNDEHKIGQGKVVLVASQDSEHVQVWTEEGRHISTRVVRIFGTGEPIYEKVHHIGSTTAGSFVWHVYEMLAPDDIDKEEEAQHDDE